VWWMSLGYRDAPFAEPAARFCPVPGHDDAASAVAMAVEAGEPWLMLRGASGVGVSTVLREALQRCRCPGRPAVVIEAPTDPDDLRSRLGDWLLGRTVAGAGSSEPPRRDFELRKLLAWSSSRPVVAVESRGAGLSWAEIREFGAALGGVRGESGIGTWIVASTVREGESPPVVIGEVLVPRLTYSEAAAYLSGRCAEAGGPADVWSREAVRAIHASAGGLPRRINAWARRALEVAAARSERFVGADSVIEPAVGSGADEPDAVGSGAGSW